MWVGLSQTWCQGRFSHLCSSQIDSWCKENSYVIAGYYQANERVKDARYGLYTCGWRVRSHRAITKVLLTLSLGCHRQSLSKSPFPTPCFIRYAGNWPDEQPGFYHGSSVMQGGSSKRGSSCQVCTNLLPPTIKLVSVEGRVTLSSE